jgi:phage FluMu protein Com
MQEIRCGKCNKLLGKTFVVERTGNSEWDITDKQSEQIVEIKCPRCGELNTNKKESVENG